MTVTMALLAGCSPASGESLDDSGAAPREAKATPSRAGMRVETAVIGATDARLQLVRPGEAEASREVGIASAMGGIIERLNVDDGDEVRAGERIAEVDRKLYAAQRSIAAVEHDDAERELERVQGMGGAVASQRIDQATTRLARAEAQLRLSDIQRARTTIEAPFAGVLAEVTAERGGFVPPGGTLARLLQLDPIVVSVSVADRDVGSLSVGGKARVTTSGTPSPVEGTVSFVAPAADLKTRTFRVEVEVDNPETRIRPGMIATVEFEGEGATAALVIPQDFLVTRLEGNGVFVVGDDGAAAWRPLQLGELIRDQVVVTSGLAQGDEVVVVGQRGLVDGDPLIVERCGQCCREGRVEFDLDAPRPAGAADGHADAAPAVEEVDR